MNSKIIENNLILSFESDVNIVNYQIKMIENNSIDNIIPFKTNRINNTINFKYNIGDKQSLEEYVKARNLNYDIYVGILKKILILSKTLEVYLLSKDNIFLLPKYIFINKDNMDIEFIYLPINNNLEINRKESIINLIEWITTKVNVNDNRVVKLSCEIFKYSKHKDFKLNDIQKLIDYNNKQLLQNNKEINDTNKFNNFEPQDDKKNVKKDNNKDKNKLKKITSIFNEKDYKKVVIIIQIITVAIMFLVLFFLRDYSSENKIGAVLIVGVIDIIIIRKIKDVKVSR